MTTQQHTTLPDKAYLTTAEAARHFGVAKSTLRCHWAKKGAPCEKVDGRWSWPWRSLEVWVKQQDEGLDGFEPTKNGKADWYATGGLVCQKAGDLAEEINWLILEIRVRCLLAAWQPIKRDVFELRKRAEFFRSKDR